MKRALLNTRQRESVDRIRTGHRKQTTLTLAGAMTVLALAACSSNSEGDSGSPAATNDSTGSPSAKPKDPASETAASSNARTPITITAGDQTFKATLNKTKVAQDFAKMLPVTLPWSRNAEIEYITELDAPLTESGPFYTDVQPGDLVYYNPLDSITIIYEETSSVPTLTKMGKITTSDLDAFENLPNNVDMRIEAG